jgi:hypothetical protein
VSRLSPTSAGIDGDFARRLGAELHRDEEAA